MKLILTLLLCLYSIKFGGGYRELAPRQKSPKFAGYISAMLPIIRLDTISLLIPEVERNIRCLDSFKIPANELSIALLAIAVSEGATTSRIGSIAFNSKLTIKLNNPFGIKGNGEEYMTTEYEGGQCVKKRQKFAKFSSIEEAIGVLTCLFASSNRYEKARKSIKGEAFLRELQKAGYATSPDWFERFIIPTYKKLSYEYRKNSEHRYLNIVAGRIGVSN